MNKKNPGIALVLTVLVMPVLLLIGALIVDGGRFYITQSQLNFQAQQATQSGLITLNQIFLTKAEENYEETCTEEPLPEVLPEICEDPIMENFLALTEKQALISQHSTLNTLTQDIKKITTLPDITFPYNPGTNPNKVYIKVGTSAQPKTHFKKLLDSDQTLFGTHVSSMDL